MPGPGPDENIEAPPQQPPLFGLLQAAAVENIDEDVSHWLAGLAFRGASIAALEFSEICTTQNFAVTNLGRVATRDPHPFYISVREECSTFGFAENDYRARAEAALAIRESWGVERQFEQALLMSGEDHLASINPAGATTVILAGGDRVSAEDGLALLDESIAQSANVIGRGMIHAPPFVFSKWGGKTRFADDLNDGKLPLSPMGNIMVGGSGYQGANPTTGAVDATHADQWAYATDIVSVVRSATIMSIPESLSQAIDKKTNTVNVRAARAYAVLWPVLHHAAVRIATTTPAVP